jgi:phosphatidylinositol alpha-mannosyltransferase
VDLLHVHEPLMPTVSISALRAGRPVVATFHASPGTIGGGFYSVAGSRLGRFLGPNVRLVTAVSKTAARHLAEHVDVTIVPNGVNVDSFAIDVGRLPARVAFLGRDEKRKGLDVLLQAWEEVAAAVPTAELIVMGADRGVDGIRWLGPVEETGKREGLASSAIYVAPNLGGESFGIVLVEGMAAGAAVVASDLASFRDVGGDAARFFPAGDSPALARVLIELLNSPGAVEQLSRAGRERARRFDWSVVTGEYRELYDLALS